jgi:Flp pilus assembly protein TadG
MLSVLAYIVDCHRPRLAPAREEARVARIGSKRPRAGQAIVELSLLMPWVFFLFASPMDFGFYYNPLISTQNAARVAALYTAQCAGTVAGQATACQRAQLELSIYSDTLIRTSTFPNSSAAVNKTASAPRVFTTSMKDVYVCGVSLRHREEGGNDGTE